MHRPPSITYIVIFRAASRKHVFKFWTSGKEKIEVSPNYQVEHMIIRYKSSLRQCN